VIEVLATGPQATIQDLGRPGFGHLGVPAAGAADPPSLRLANRIVGNPEQAACVEILLGDLSVRFHLARAFALTGAPAPAWLDEKPVGWECWQYARAGQVLRVARPVFGLRSYLAVSGGLAVQPVLGSRSTDTLSRLGPPPLEVGVELPFGATTGATTGVAGFAVAQTVRPESIVFARVRLGPRDEHFAPQAITTLLTHRWVISDASDRIAVRLDGPGLPTRDSGQLPTEGLALGSVQVPPSGQPIVHLANHPPTGGYPVIVVVAQDDVPRLAQARPGTGLRFVR
jgi:biotin-dependent carboxylase-like uncharacterized protein